jgi:hypothetical protein
MSAISNFGRRPVPTFMLFIVSIVSAPPLAPHVRQVDAHAQPEGYAQIPIVLHAAGPDGVG